MKCLAIIDFAEGARLERVCAEFMTELKASWALLAADVLREAP